MQTSTSTELPSSQSLNSPFGYEVTLMCSPLWASNTVTQFPHPITVFLGEPPKRTQNYLLEDSPARWCSKSHLHQCTSRCYCERLFGFSEFFWRLFQCICPFHDGWYVSAPAHSLLSVQQFLTKSRLTLCPTLPIHPISPPATFFVAVSLDEKSPQREKCCWYIRYETKKTAWLLKGIKINASKTVLSSGKNILVGVLHQMKSTLKVTEV